MRKKIGVCALAFVLALAGSGFFAKSASAANLGGVSVYLACKNQYTSAYHWEVFIQTHNVMGWRCHLNKIKQGSVSVDLNKQCRVQYGKSWAQAKYTNFNDPFSWYCEG